MVENIIYKADDAPLGKSITKKWNKFQKNVVWKLVDRKRVNF